MKFIYSMLFVVMTTISANAQFALKTNLLYDATATINLGAELTVAPRWSVDLSGNFNAWSVSGGKRWKHWFVQPEARYWFCDATAGHFVGAHLIGGKYNIGHIDLSNTKFLGTDFSGLKDHRYQGWFGGVGIGYGYTWILGRHFNLETEIGIGWLHSRYDVYECAGCGRNTARNRHHNYVGPTKAAVNLVYLF